MKSTVALIVDTPPFVVGALRLTWPAVPPSWLTIVKINPSSDSVSGELNLIDALLVLPEIAPDICPVNVIASSVAVLVIVRVNVSTTGSGDPGGAPEAVVNVPKLTLFTGGTVAADSSEV
jgi:hypothetical protein